MTAETSKAVKVGLFATLFASVPLVCGCGIVTLVFGSCLGAHTFARSAPPVEKTVALVESSPPVRAALGEDVSVSLAVARVFERDVARALGGQDHVRLHTSVRGDRGEATLELSAQNLNDQGWAGSFSLTTEGRPVLRNGSYVTDGGGTLLRGSFAPDGTPQVAPP
jgi:hypothetical protein